MVNKHYVLLRWWGLVSNQHRTVSHLCMTCNCLLVACPDYFLQAPSDSYVGLCFHIVWCNTKGVGDIEILGTYLNSASKNTSERHFSSWDKIFVDQFNLPTLADFSGSLWGKFVNSKHNKMILPSIPVTSMISVQCSHRLSPQYVTTAHIHKLLNIWPLSRNLHFTDMSLQSSLFLLAPPKV